MTDPIVIEGWGCCEERGRRRAVTPSGVTGAEIGRDGKLYVYVAAGFGMPGAVARWLLGTEPSGDAGQSKADAVASPVCSSCRRQLTWSGPDREQAIRCLDCREVFCENCARGHFPTESALRAEITLLKQQLQYNVPASASDGREWVSVEERKPPPGVMVQFHVPGYPERARFVGFWSGRPERFEDMTDTDGDGDPREHYDATHWAPLLPPPAQGKGERDGQG